MPVLTARISAIGTEGVEELRLLLLELLRVLIERGGAPLAAFLPEIVQVCLGHGAVPCLPALMGISRSTHLQCIQTHNGSIANTACRFLAPASRTHTRM